MPVVLKPGAGQLDGQRQADVAEADDADVGGAPEKFLFEGLGDAGKRCGCGQCSPSHYRIVLADPRVAAGSVV